MSNELFREVDEEVRQEQFKQFFRRYGKYAAGLALAVLVGAGGYLLWQENQRQAIERAASGFEEAQILAQTQPRMAADILAGLIDDAPQGYRALIGMQQAQSLLQAGDRDAALRVYERLAADADLPELDRDLAQIHVVIMQFENLTADDLLARLGPMTAEGRVWRYPALELQGLAQVKANRPDEARKIFQQLADDPSAPNAMRARVIELLTALGGPVKG